MSKNPENRSILSTPEPKAIVSLIYLILLVIIILFNSLKLCSENAERAQIRRQRPYQFLGLKFSGLNETLKGQTHVGYYTDKDLDDRVHAMQFSQAQYLLAPVVLDLNNLKYEYIFFDCINELTALNIIKENGFIAIKKNAFGIILAQNRNSSNQE